MRYLKMRATSTGSMIPACSHRDARLNLQMSIVRRMTPARFAIFTGS